MNEFVKRWDISERLRSFKLDHNKFIKRTSIEFLSKLFTAPNLKYLTLNGCKFS
jgi:hypothetical protein